MKGSYPLDPRAKVYMYQNDPIDLTRESAEDLEGIQALSMAQDLWPCLSGGALDIAFFGSVAIVALLTLLSILGVREFIDLGVLFTFNYNLDLSIIIGTLGIRNHPRTRRR